MKLIKIGRSSSNDIVLNSDKVSAVHAEMIVLDNGDILLEDKNSRNGTFVGNNLISPNVETLVRRGDYVCFANVELQWAEIPKPDDNRQYSRICNIGSNYRNDIQIDGATVSRFHATVKYTKDNKIFIYDHSRNGTTVNGVKIKSRENYRLKHGDIVACGGVPIKIEIPRPIWPKILCGAGIAAAIVSAVFLMLQFFSGPSVPNDYVAATTYVHAYFFYEVTFEDDPFEFGTIKIDKSYKVGDQEPIVYSGTAFLIDGKGYMATNRHVAVPWEYLESAAKERINQTIAVFRERAIPLSRIKYREDLEELKAASAYGRAIDMLVNKELSEGVPVSTVLNKYNALINRFKNSPYKISGTMEYMAVGYAGRNYSSSSEFDRCVVIEESGDPKIDIAILQLNTKKTPENIKTIFKIHESREEKLNPQMDELFTIGYPAGLALNLDADRKMLIPRTHSVRCSSWGKYNFEFQDQSLGGASGTPVIDKKGRLVGVLNNGYGGTNHTYAVQVKFLKEMYNKVIKENE